MNTVKIGNEFESLVYDKFSTLLNNNMLHVNSSLSKIIKKPRYYSQQRESKIEFDISIETTQFQSNEMTMLTIIECKKYSSKKVPVDDVEEFVKKLDQVAGKNIKGILCSSLGFQEGCLTFAKNNNIALIRMSPEEGFSWDLYRMQSKDRKSDLIKKNIINTLTDDRRNIPEGFFCACIDDIYTYSIFDFLRLLRFDVKQQKDDLQIENSNIPYLSDAEINEIIRLEFTKRSIYFDLIDYKSSYDKFIDSISNQTRIIENCDLGIDSRGYPVVGMYSENQIFISRTSNDSVARYNFTLSHEIGHKILHSHQEWFIDFSEKYLDVEYENQQLFLQPKKIKQIETQANLFASELLLPDKVLTKIMEEIIIEERLVDKGYGLLFLDHQVTNRQLLSKIIDIISRKTRASRMVIEIKLEKLGFLKKSNKKEDQLKDVMRKFKV